MKPAQQPPAAPPAPNLPDALQRPYPDSVVLEERKQREQEELITRLCAADPDFARLCRLFREESRREERLSFLRKAAQEYLNHEGPPTGELSCYSELLPAVKDDQFWFVGDVHGSLDALLRLYACVLDAAHTHEGRCQHLVLLGDIIDRGEQSLETLGVVLHLLRHPHPRVKPLMLRGNHDAGLYEEEDRFDSCVSPAEFIEELDSLLQSNKAEEQTLGRLLGRAALRLAELSPVMAEITGLDPEHPERTLLCTHGGLPHTDLQAKLAQREQDCVHPAAGMPYLGSIPGELREDFALDYTWIRLVDKAPRKQPNRGNMGCQMGTQDVNAYRLQHWQRSGRAVGFIIRGHDHEQAGWALYSYDEQLNPARGRFVQRHCGVLTLNSMDPDMSSCGLFTKRDVAIARCAPGRPVILTLLEGIPPGQPEADEEDDTPNKTRKPDNAS